MNIKQYIATRKQIIRDFCQDKEIKPHMVIIQVNDNEASNAYIGGKMKDSLDVGIKTTLMKYPAHTTQQELIDIISKVNKDKSVHGLIVQMPLPRHIDEEAIKLAVDPRKDIDGFHPLSHLEPCTPKGIINILKHEKIDLTGKNAVIIGRSNIVGKPMAKLLLNNNCNVTTLHSKTTKHDMHNYLSNADIIVIAIGKKFFLNSNDWKFKPTAIVVDVGINRDEGGIFGDAAPNLPVAIQTPVPGGVGLITRLTLIENLIEAYKNEIHNY